IGAFEVQTPPPRVTNIEINGGASQRSRVTTLKIEFDSAVTLPSPPEQAFQLSRQSDGATVTLSAFASANDVFLNFAGGAVDNISLKDGRYTLTVFSVAVLGLGGHLDGNGDGAAGDNYVLVGDTTNKLFRLFGDSDGSGNVDAIDFGAFRSAFGTTNSTF